MMRFWLGLMFSITDEAVCSATDGFSGELSMETVGEDDEQCREKRGIFAREFEDLECGNRNSSVDYLLYSLSGERKTFWTFPYPDKGA